VLAVLAAVGIAPGPLRALLVAGPLSTYALPWLAAVAEWRLGAGPGVERGGGRRAAILGPAGRALLVAIGTAAALAGAHALSWRGATAALLPGGGPRVPPWPCLMPQGALAFVAFVQVSGVSEARPRIVAMRPPVRCAVVVACFAAGAVLSALLVDWSGLGPWPGAEPRWRPGPVPAFELLAWLACTAAWQVVHGVLGGGPVARIRRRGARVLAANAAVLALATLTWAALRLWLGVPGPRLAAGCALVVAGGALARAGRRPPARAAHAILLTAGYTAAAGVPLAAAASLQRWPSGTPAELWLVICGLNLVPAALLAAAGLPPRPDPAERSRQPDTVEPAG
jgi:hypothetical protein